jgi:hypothetical protein
MADFAAHNAVLDRLERAQSDMNERMTQRVQLLEHALEVETNKRRYLVNRIREDHEQTTRKIAVLENWVTEFVAAVRRKCGGENPIAHSNPSSAAAESHAAAAESIAAAVAPALAPDDE